MKVWRQDPGEKIYYRQGIIGDTITSAVWSISPTGPTLDDQDEGSDWSCILVSGLTIDTKYRLTIHIVAESGQKFKRSCMISCVDL